MFSKECAQLDLPRREATATRAAGTDKEYEIQREKLLNVLTTELAIDLRNIELGELTELKVPHGRQDLLPGQPYHNEKVDTTRLVPNSRQEEMPADYYKVKKLDSYVTGDDTTLCHANLTPSLIAHALAGE